MSTLALKITTYVFGEDVDRWINDPDKLNNEQKKELISTNELKIKRTNTSFTQYNLVGEN